MPRPPQLDELDELSFITNYFVQGCTIPPWAIAEFSRKPAKDAFLLMFMPDLADVVKGWLRPKHGRKRKPGRHGRKRPWRKINLDINDMIGSNAPGHGDIYPGIDLPGARMLFRLSDHWDNVAWTGAVISGLSDIGFETLHGFISSHPEYCPDYAFCNASNFDGEAMVGVAPWATPFGWTKIDSFQNWEPPRPFVTGTVRSDYTLGWSAEIEALSSGGTDDFALTVIDQSGKELGRSNFWNGAKGDVITLACAAEVPEGEFVACARRTNSGSVYVRKMQLFGFAGTWL